MFVSFFSSEYFPIRSLRRATKVQKKLMKENSTVFPQVSENSRIFHSNKFLYIFQPSIFSKNNNNSILITIIIIIITFFLCSFFFFYLINLTGFFFSQIKSGDSNFTYLNKVICDIIVRV